VAFSKRHPGAFVSFDSTWSTGTENDETSIAWTRKGAAVIDKYADGAYLQWAGFEDERKEASGRQFDDINRLTEIKKKHDPENLFPHWLK
jgi:FAD/FMN-containing dehydrogenase